MTVLNLSFSGSLLFALLWSVAIARTPEEAQLYELEKLRGEVAGQIEERSQIRIPATKPGHQGISPCSLWKWCSPVAGSGPGPSS